MVCKPQFVQAEERPKRRCGEVTPSVLADVERLLRQTRGLVGMNGQCTVTNLRLLLGHHGLTISGTKVELVQRVHNHIDRRHTKVAKAQELGFDLGKEIEQAVEDISRRVEERIGHGFRISESTVRHCVAAKHSATIVAKRHNPIAAVSHQRFSKAADEWNIDGQVGKKCHYFGYPPAADGAELG